jgi:mannose/cellobiose epimerase-like protein (N-acyl-D-glucosamine 2-epimerase family)
MSLSELKKEIKRIKDREAELLEEKENVERELKPGHWFEEFRLLEIEGRLKYVRERLEKALDKEAELELKQARDKSDELER